jgi:hypothetical protein
MAVFAAAFRDAALLVGLIPVRACLPALILRRVTVFATLRAAEFAGRWWSRDGFRLGGIVRLGE